MKLFGVFGNPIAHSKSPLLHNAIFLALEQTLGFKGNYQRILITEGNLLGQTFLELGLQGANITSPFKQVAFSLSDAIKGLAQNLGAINTWVLEKGKLVGYNTDIEGFYLPLKEPLQTLDKPPAQITALILGAGGSARAVACALHAVGISISVLNRSEAKLDFFKAQDLPCFTPHNFKPQSYDLIINTTTAGFIDDNLPCDRKLLGALFKQARIAYDLIYHKPTPFLQLARQHGLITLDGKAMLITQAALSFALFCHHQVPLDQILEVMGGILK
ncbi:Shikimate 5-dehydrogenase [Helicobacter bizzozeronii]|nr:Shikimate 5-dehydrogenase [Helicobacter bizzozeronii]